MVVRMTISPFGRLFLEILLDECERKFASAIKPGHQPCEKALFNGSNKLKNNISTSQIGPLANVRFLLRGYISDRQFL